MTDKDLNKYFKYKKEAEDLENRLKEFGDGVKSIPIKEIVISSSGTQPSIQERRQELYDLYIEKRVSALEECWKIEQYIKEIDDPEIRTIIRLRNINLLTWNEIAARMSDESKDYTEYSVKCKYYRFFKKNSK